MRRPTRKHSLAYILAVLFVACMGLVACGHSTSGQIPDPEIFTPTPTPSEVVAVDSDGDGFVDGNDNCPLLANADQRDLDGDGVGDACDDDVDGDTIANVRDNCPVDANTEQLDSDGDGIGDVCDPSFDDRDLDGIGDSKDNCPDDANVGQEDMDHDGIGDVCDDDMDGDNVQNAADNCPVVPNNDQVDTDGDGLGNACDPDMDNDGVLNDPDNCPIDANAGQEDLDGDGIGDVCDGDLDGDTVQNVDDNCVTTPNTDQANMDHDALGDVCDPDMDGDGVLNVVDNCPIVANADQANADGDVYDAADPTTGGDACDTDADNDGIFNPVANLPWNKDGDGKPWESCAISRQQKADGVLPANCYDNCWLTVNPDQLDTDGDANNPLIVNRGGDVCDKDNDNDGILDDGGLDGTIGNNPCTGYGSLGNPTGDGAQTSCDDNCRFTPNADQIDIDADGIGNVCSDDYDGDGIKNPSIDLLGEPVVLLDGGGIPYITCSDGDNTQCYDNCAYLQNADQVDLDSDDFGDTCDADKDGDGFFDIGVLEENVLFDHCPLNASCH